MMILLTAWRWLTSKAGMILAAVVAALLLVRSLISAGEDKQKAKEAERQRKAREGARKIENEVRRTDPDARRERLRRDWSR